MKPDDNNQNPSAGSSDDPAVEYARRQVQQQFGADESRVESLIERFWRHHQDHPDKEQAWHDYYNSLSDVEKYQLWQEYEQAVEPEASVPKVQTATEFTAFSTPSAQSQSSQKKTTTYQSVADMKKKLLEHNRSKAKGPKHRLKPLIAAISIGFVLLFLNYNDLVVAQVKQYISPGDSLRSPIIVDPNAKVSVSDEPRIIIPKINVDVPVVYTIKSYDENKIQAALEDGVVHYGQTPVPGQAGNNVIVGHSSNNFFNAGKYKFAFVLLDRLEKGDTFILHYRGTRYIYRVYNKKIVDPDDFSIIQPTAVPTTTLVTCTPPGTSWNRLAIHAEQISPEPTEKKPSNQPIIADDAKIVPGNSPSLFQRLRDWLFN